MVETRESTRPVRVLLYSDMESIVPHCVAAAEILRRELGAHIVMLVGDTIACSDPAFSNYDLYDHKSVFRLSKRCEPIKPSRSGSNGSPNSSSKAGLSNDGGTGSPIATVDPYTRTRWSHLQKFLARFKMVKASYRRFRAFRESELGLSLAYLPKAMLRAFFVPRFLRAVRPDLMILAEDNIERMSTTLISEGRKRSIPSIIIPFTIPNPLEGFRAYRHLKLHQVKGPLARILSWWNPKWVFGADGQSLLRIPAFSAMVLELFGQSSPAPWVLNRGRASRIALDSEALRSTYLKLGFPPEQLCVVGDVNSEKLWAGLKERERKLADLSARLGFKIGLPLILCGFPPDQFANNSDDFEFNDYEPLIKGWMGTFSSIADRANILIRPHPRVRPERYDALKAPNVYFTLEPTIELIPLCDLYVASISATIRWALACGIPVINYDTYRYRYGDYDGAVGLSHTETLSEFRDLLDRFVSDPAYAADLTQRQMNARRHWGAVDAKLAERFAALVREVIMESRLGNWK